jgi:hypothetical protein
MIPAQLSPTRSKTPCTSARTLEGKAMASKIEVGSEVVRNHDTQRMRVLGFGEIDGRQHAWCEWRDEKGVAEPAGGGP